MGKSDPYIFQHYIKAITSYHSHLDFESVCLLGQPADNGFTQYINAKQKDFFDVSVGNWNINHFPYRSKKQYDLVICTRCPYFCIDPLAFLRECNSLLRPGGKLFVDWGLESVSETSNFMNTDTLKIIYCILVYGIQALQHIQKSCFFQTE